MVGVVALRRTKQTNKKISGNGDVVRGVYGGGGGRGDKER